MLASFLFATLASATPPHGGRHEAPRHLPHAVAFVNDPLSHGAIGDSLLSLNEAIQLHNRTLSIVQLSPSEQGQLSGLGQDVSWVSIDATLTPTIVVERDLDQILDLPHGLLIDGYNGLPTIDFTASNVQHGFRSLSNFCDWRHLVLHGGNYGIDVVQTNATYGSTVRDVVFDGQAQFGMRVSAGVAGARLRILMEECHYIGMNTGLRILEQSPSCLTLLVVLGTTMVNVTNGIEIVLGHGGSGIYQLDQLDLDVLGTGIGVSRPNNASRSIVLQSVQSRVRGATAVSIAGASFGDTRLSWLGGDLSATSLAGTAFQLSPLGTRVTGAIDDLKADGAVTIWAGAALAPLVVTNARIRNGPVQVGSSGGQVLQLVDCRFDNCVLAVSGTVATQMMGCCVVGGSVQGSPNAPLQTSTSSLQTVVGPFVTQASPLPAQQLGSFTVLPANITIGGPLVFQADLPAGLVGIFLLGLSQDPLVFALPAYPLHVYSELSFTSVIPGIYRLQQNFQFSIPNNPGLVGTDFTAHMGVLPDPGVIAPAYNFPPGRRFALR